MILPLLLLAGISGPQVVSQVSRVPASYAKSSVSCSLELEGSVRQVYPQYNIVTGERFIAQIDPNSCSILSTQTHEASSCVDGSCSDQATSVVKVDDTTLYYCYTNNKSPKPMTATLQGDGTYAYSSGGLSDICLHDVTKSSYIALNAVDQLLYIVTDSKYTAQLGFKYYDIATSEHRSSPTLEDIVTNIAGMFTRRDYLYTVYMDPDSRITRSCQKDLSEFDITTFTVASLQCVNTINGVQVVLDRVLDMVYSITLDKLFILATQAPLSSASVALCVLDVAQDIATVFDTSLYYWINEKGAYVKAAQDKIDCSASRKYPVITKCVDPVKTTKIATTTKTTDVFSFAHYETNGHHLLYLLGEDSLNVYEYTSETGKARSITEVVLWTKPSSIALYQDLLYITSSESVLISKPYWCSYYLKDPVTCLGSMHPSCWYSKTRSRCLPTAQCTHPDECVQSLEDGSFSAAFPDGYSYTILGTECQNKMFYTDLKITYHPNTTVTTQNSYRDCSTDTPVTGIPSKQTVAALTGRELGLVIGMVCCAAAFLFILAILIFRGKSRLCEERSPSPSVRKTIAPPETRGHDLHTTIQVVGICNGLDPYNTTVRYTAEDKQAIVTSSAPTTPDHDVVNNFPPRHNSNNTDNCHTSVYRNPSASTDPLS